MTPEQLAKCTGATVARAAIYLPYLERAWGDFDITTPLRQAAFLAQSGHETMFLSHMREIWGNPPTPAQAGYEGRADLGNTEPGDGKLYMGRGFFMLTGRANYERMSKDLATDFISNPELLEEADMAVRSGMMYWNWRGLSKFADAKDFGRITYRINGGTNGAASRLALFNVGITVLGA